MFFGLRVSNDISGKRRHQNFFLHSEFDIGVEEVTRKCLKLETSFRRSVAVVLEAGKLSEEEFLAGEPVVSGFAESLFTKRVRDRNAEKLTTPLLAYFVEF